MRHLNLLILVGWAVVIFIVSSFPNPPDAGGGEWQYQLAHAFEYFVFGVLALRATLSELPRKPLALAIAIAWLVSVAYGMSDEFHQSFVPNRDANWEDVGVDAFGAAVGVLVGAWFARRAALRIARSS